MHQRRGWCEEAVVPVLPSRLAARHQSAALLACGPRRLDGRPVHPPRLPGVRGVALPPGRARRSHWRAHGLARGARGEGGTQGRTRRASSVRFPPPPCPRPRRPGCAGRFSRRSGLVLGSLCARRVHQGAAGRGDALHGRRGRPACGAKAKTKKTTNRAFNPARPCAGKNGRALLPLRCGSGRGMGNGPPHPEGKGWPPHVRQPRSLMLGLQSGQI